MTTQTGPRLAITGTCEGCAWLRSTPGFAHDCTHDDAGGGSTVLGPIPRKIGRRPVTPAWCPLLPAARLALARSICNHCGADIAPDYLGLYAKPTCEKCANERTGDTTDGPLCADCGDPLADPTTADECSAAHGAGKSEE